MRKIISFLLIHKNYSNDWTGHYALVIGFYTLVYFLSMYVIYAFVNIQSLHKTLLPNIKNYRIFLQNFP